VIFVTGAFISKRVPAVNFLLVLFSKNDLFTLRERKSRVFAANSKEKTKQKTFGEIS